MTAPASAAAPDASGCQPRIALTCPYCGAGLMINMETAGPAYLTYERPESIECDAYSDVHCGATWEPDGTPRDAPGWVRWPDLYPAPDRTPLHGPSAAGKDQNDG